ncbi:hypothetical protein [Gemmobacter serpentinus]|uniref:hypothetical protein n=1 Tax=Gemmobacter serpentinus TaxID=2652247 RepID=UPI00124BFFAC|nr:hypothetical protein [Gemmobacter serpentinus]
MTPLLPGEQVLWQGRPGGGVPADLSNPGRLLFGFAFVAFSLFWMDKAMASGPIWLGGLPFLFIGLKLSVWQAWAPRLRAKVAVYRLTETRVLVDLVWPLIGTRSAVMSPGPSTIVERSGGPATITLRHQVAGPRGNATESLTLLRLDEADHVMALIRQMQRNAA